MMRKVNSYHPILLHKKYSFRYLAFLVLCAALFSCSTQRVYPRKSSVRENRHACNYCHLHDSPQSDPELFIPKGESATICIWCHDYASNHHPVDFSPSKTKYVSPGKEFPLFEGKVECITCHDPHAGPDFSETPNLLRGGPYSDRREICFKCHYQENYAQIYPHQMLDEKGDIRLVEEKPVCLVCHASMPNPETDQTGDVRFRADVGFLCWRCHPPMPGNFFTNHFLKRPSRTTMKSMRNAEKELEIIFPIVPRNRITCSTCHNPHQKGVIVTSAAQKGADAPMRLRMQSPAICISCHPTK